MSVLGLDGSIRDPKRATCTAAHLAVSANTVEPLKTSHFMCSITQAR